MEAIFFGSMDINGKLGSCCGRTETTALPSICYVGYLLGLCRLLLSLGSSSSSVESAGEGAAVLSSKCSCWDKYCAGVCLAARAQCSSSLCSNGRLACKGKCMIIRVNVMEMSKK